MSKGMAKRRAWERCERCGELPPIWGGLHACPPAWKVWPEGEEEEYAFTIYAITAERAAEKYGQEYDANGDYPIVSGSEKRVCVRELDEDEDAASVWAVTARLDPTYSATAVNAAAGKGRGARS